MARRILVSEVRLGRLMLHERQAHHVRDVLRLSSGDTVEIFDAAGKVAPASIISCSPSEVVVEVPELAVARARRLSWTVAAAVPKAARADWMIEKLSELGTSRFVPLATARSVVHPEGKNKIDRWQRLAEEAARQSRGDGVMQIDGLAPLEAAMVQCQQANAAGFYLSTDPQAQRFSTCVASAVASFASVAPPRSFWLFIGPEGGWDPGEIARFEQAGLTAAALTDTILRVETAAIVAAAILATLPAA